MPFARLTIGYLRISNQGEARAPCSELTRWGRGRPDRNRHRTPYVVSATGPLPLRGERNRILTCPSTTKGKRGKSTCLIWWTSRPGRSAESLGQRSPSLSPEDTFPPS